MGATAINIINPNGTVIALGGKVGSEDYTKCFITKGEYSSEYQGASQIKLTVHSNRRLPVTIGARIFYEESDGAGGYILLSPPSIEMVSSKHFVYGFSFLGNIHLLETKLLFNQSLKGDGWNLSFSLVGTATDFLTLICVNMNRTEPIEDPISEIWVVGKVDDTTSQLLIDFDNDNCLTALRKVSEAFNLPYRTSLSGSIITLDLTNECRVHDHSYTIGDGLLKFKMVGDSDRPFATVLHVLGGMKNIPYDYQGGVRRLRAAEGDPANEEVMYDDGTSSGAWTTAKDNYYPSIDVNFSSTHAVFHGTKAMRIWSNTGGAITGQRIKITGSDFNAVGRTLIFYLYLEPGSSPYFGNAKLLFTLGNGADIKSIEVNPGMYGFNQWVQGSWQQLKIPISDFGLANGVVDTLKFEMTGYWPAGAKLHVDYIYLSYASSELDSFVMNANNIAAYGRIEAVAINEDIYPKSDFAITTKVSDYKFIDDSIDFDLNEKDGEGNTVYIIVDVEPKITFTSGNLSGYSFAIKAYTTTTQEIELVPYTDDRGQDIPDPDPDSKAFQFDVGDTYVITEINMPDSYVTAAEEDLLEWGIDQYVDYSALNEIAEIEIDPVWVKKATDLKYILLGESPSVEYDLNPLTDLFKAGDLITVTIEGLFSRQLRVTSATHEFYSKNAVWKLSLGNYTPINLAGRLISQMNGQQYKLNNTLENLKLVKYFMG